MQLFINVHKLEEHARQLKHLTGKLRAVKVTQLGGGFVSQGVYRLDLLFETYDQLIASASYVQKYSSSAEVRVMQALTELEGADAIPGIIDYAGHTATENEPSAHWFITPFYEGKEITFEDDVPVSVIESLAQVHVFFKTRVQSIDYLHRVDSAFFRRTFDNALEFLAKAQQERQNHLFDKAYRLLSHARENTQVYEILVALPVTLTHGDVHPGNILCSPDGVAMLVDWGNARIAPNMLDIANMVEMNSATWHRYISAWETASGEPMEVRLAQLGYHWATIMINTQYLPYAVDFTPPENVEKMVVKVVQAQENIAALVSS